MRIMFISDIHGIKNNLELVKQRYNELKCTKLVVLGDLYYIGPRNNMNGDYDINYVKDFLMSFKDDLLCVRGNCDSDVDIKVSDFPIINELGLISTENKDIYITHGHIYNESNWNKTNSTLEYIDASIVEATNLYNLCNSFYLLVILDLYIYRSLLFLHLHILFHHTKSNH